MLKHTKRFLEFSLERRDSEPAQAADSSSRRSPGTTCDSNPCMSVSNGFFACARDEGFYVPSPSEAGYSKRVTLYV
jgi:hypothetical protein